MNKREIKFRFRLRLLVDELGSLKKGDIDTFFIPLLGDTNGLIRFPIDARWEILSCDQFTCLNDKNGKEIYEGDIMRVADNINSVVSFNDETGAFCVEHDGEKSDHLFGSTLCEIIGNIYEHPKLLTK